MQQLQAWADEGRFIFPCDDDKTGSFLQYEKGKLPYAKGTDLYNITPKLQLAIEMVLNGTIPVWRPVEHYKPTEAYVLGLCEHECVRLGIVYEKQDGFWMLAPERSYTSNVKITHWMPTPALTQPPKEGSDDHNRRNAG